ncbi:Tify 5a [Thalictrum thalictroides]|uniref:Protein TIFY n=1 Tax=Thalictrum thalictroides TaxID=46969 RepID=A0A7J6WD54_THATH|nr:Tify 5a [Thalictrum thalictroides]
MKETVMPLAMRRNCNLDLCLVPPSSSSSSICVHDDFIDGKKKEVSNENQQQTMTIFYNGKICVCDVTELQAKAILHHAYKETEERLKSPYNSHSEPASPCLSPYQLHSPSATGMSMKKSLQRFLQKRKDRMQNANSPYITRDR